VAECYAQMREIAAHAGALGDHIVGRRQRIGHAADLIEVVVDPIAHCRDTLIGAGQSAKSPVGKASKLIRLAGAVEIRVGQHMQGQFARRDFTRAVRPSTG
jgi:hypothetical protein